MTFAAFDTLKAVETLREAGIEEAHAKAIASTMRDAVADLPTFSRPLSAPWSLSFPPTSASPSPSCGCSAARDTAGRTAGTLSPGRGKRFRRPSGRVRRSGIQGAAGGEIRAGAGDEFGIAGEKAASEPLTLTPAADKVPSVNNRKARSVGLPAE